MARLWHRDPGGSVGCDNSIHVGSVVCDNSIHVGSIVCINSICDPGGESSVSHEWIVMVVSGARCMVTPRGWGWGGVLPSRPEGGGEVCYNHCWGWGWRVSPICHYVMDISRCILPYKRVIWFFRYILIAGPRREGGTPAQIFVWIYQNTCCPIKMVACYFDIIHDCWPAPRGGNPCPNF